MLNPWKAVKRYFFILILYFIILGLFIVRIKRNFTVCLICLLMLPACSWSKKEPEKTADELAADGQRYFDKQNYTEAIKAYKKLGDWYPFSVHAKNAALRIGDAHYLAEEYDEAVLAYNEYERMHPNDPKVPYVIYQTGLCHYDRIKTIDRDSTFAANALSTFRRLIEQYPDSDYALKARPLMLTCATHLAAKELYVAKFYFKSKKYKAALQRFEGLIQQFPNSEFQGEALEYIDQCKILLQAENR